MIDQAVQRKLIQAVAEAMIAHADELTALDQAIGDGDHGLNMKRGFESVLANIDALAAQPLPDALKAIGTRAGDEGRRRFGPALWDALSHPRQDHPGRSDPGRSSLVASAPQSTRSRPGASRTPVRRPCWMCSLPCTRS